MTDPQKPKRMFMEYCVYIIYDSKSTPSQHTKHTHTHTMRAAATVEINAAAAVRRWLWQ